MDQCGEIFHSCVCILLEGHDQHLPHICKCGSAWDEQGLPVRWPRPERQSHKLTAMLPAAGAAWRYEASSAAFVRNAGDEGPAR